MTTAEIKAAMKKSTTLAEFVYAELPKQLRAPEEANQMLAVHILRYGPDPLNTHNKTQKKTNRAPPPLF
jgi:hypothetical protein